MQALSECWQLLITDYGVMPSIFASITIAALIFLMFLMLRNVTPRRTRQTSPPPDKRKKKRKGHTRRGNNNNNSNNGKVKGHPSTPSRQLETPISTTISIDPPSPVSSTCSMPGSSSPSDTDSFPLIPNLPVANPIPTDSSESRHVAPKPYDTLDEAPKESTGPKATPMLATTRPTATPMLSTTRPTVAPVLSTSGPTATPLLPTTTIISSKTVFEKDVRGRARVPSVSTIDTTTLSDDMSCESTSIRSELSVHVPSTPSNHVIPVQPESLPVTPVASRDTPADHQSKRGARTQTRRNNRLIGTGNTKSKMNHSPKSTGNDGTSRWDALKPHTNAKHTQNHVPSPERHNQATTGRSPENNRPNHAHPAPRQTVRRNARGGGNPKRGGRPVPAHGNHNQLITGLPQTPSSSPRPKQYSTPSPISPPALERCPHGNTVVPQQATIPTLPPPGLGAAMTSTRNNTLIAAEGTQFFSVPPKNTADLPNLFPTSLLPLEPPRPLYCPTPTSYHAQVPISPSFLASTPTTNAYDKWNDPTPSSSSSMFSASHRLVNESSAPSLSLPTRSRPHPPGGEVYSSYSASPVVVVKENPFAPEDSEAQIEAHLQALGGQMAGSILDF